MGIRDGFAGELNYPITCVITSNKKSSFKIKIYQKGEQVGGTIYCLKLGYLEEVLNQIKQKYSIRENNMQFELNPKGEKRNVR